MKYIWQTPAQFALFALFSCTTYLAQSQSLRGTVRDATNGDPLQGATVALQRSQRGASSVSIAANPNGEFAFEKLKPGYYHCSIDMQGFENQSITEILVAAGKEQVFEIALNRNVAPLPEITITSTVPGRRPLQPLSEIPLTRDQTLRFPATFFDPARLAAAYPGVAINDDGTNSMSIRGNSPAMLRWRLEGLDIVNPNHLPNAGTISDRPAAASGGVLMFSAQMIDNSSLLTGAFPAGYGDAVAGVMDMHLRAGNTRQHEFTAQAGLGGLDLAAEGPLRKGDGNSYLFNYRYSTVGLLGQLGVSFGDEQINFQDLSCHFRLKGKKGGQYSIFGLAGLSENAFRHKQDSQEVKYYKELHDIFFQSKTLVAGGTGRWKLGSRSWLKAALAYSSQENDWNKTLYEYPEPVDLDERTEERIGASIEWRRAFRNHQLSAGLQSARIFFSGKVVQVLSHNTIPGGIEGVFITPYSSSGSYFNHQPWARWDWSAPNGRWYSQIGAQFHYNNINGTLAPAPRGLLSYRIATKHKIALSAGLYKQDPPVWAMAFLSRLPRAEAKKPYISSLQTGLKYSWTPLQFWKVSAELFYQATDSIPSLGNTALNNAPELISFPVVTAGSNAQARNYGIELSLERNLSAGWFLLVNGSLFRSKYRIGNGEWLDSRWDLRHLANFTLGKEWLREKSDLLTRTIGVGLRGVWTGGAREADIDFGASESQLITVLNENQGYYRQYPDYFRADLRVYWKRSLGGRRNSTFALDIQNITGQENLAYHFYDPLSKKVENKLQLGPIPNFSWRLEF